MSNKSLAILDNAIKSKKYKSRPYVCIPKKEANLILQTQAQQKQLLDEQQSYIEELEGLLRDNGLIM